MSGYMNEFLNLDTSCPCQNDSEKGTEGVVIYIFISHSLYIGNSSRFGQRRGLQRITLTSYFYKNIYLKAIYVYFYESTFQDKSIHMVFTFSNSTT